MMIREYKHMIKTYPYGTNTFMVCENEMRYVLQIKNMLNNESQETSHKYIEMNQKN